MAPASSGISQARSRLGEGAAAPAVRSVWCSRIATRASKGPGIGGWRLVSLDGSCLDVADTEANRSRVRPARAPAAAQSAFPQLRFVALVENGTHVLFGAALGPLCRRGRDRRWPGRCWRRCVPACCAWPTGSSSATRSGRRRLATGADLLWRVKHNLRLPRETVLADGSYLTPVYPSDKDRRHRTGGVGCAWSSTGWRASPRPSRSIGW